MNTGMNIIDAHPYIYSDDRRKYPVVDDPWNPGEPATAKNLNTKMDAAGVSRAVFIQTSTLYGHDNRYVMNSNCQYSSWATGVVTLSPDNPQHPEVLEDAIGNCSVRGLRSTTDQNGKIGSARVYPHQGMPGPLRRVIEACTPDRCVWGSNFPNALWSKGSSYARNLSLFTDELGLPQITQEANNCATTERRWFSWRSSRPHAPFAPSK
jgi:predicted TIM-barrel fold metal-dependent hydrolase